MKIPSRIKLAVISLFKSAADKDFNRFQNMAAFLGIPLKPKTQPESEALREKDAAIEIDARSQGKVRDALRDVFMDLLKSRLPIGYFEESKRDTFKVREEMYQYLPDNLYETMHEKLLEILGAKAKKENYNLNSEYVILDDEVIDREILKMLDYYKNKPEEVTNIISSVFSPSKKENKKKRFEAGPGEMWFTPVVTEEVYEKYSGYIADNAAKLQKQAEIEGKDPISSPEDMGVIKGKADPYAIKILSDLRKFTIEVDDKTITTDTKESLPTVSIKFNIPELAKKRPSIYGDILYSKKLPANMGNLGRETKGHPVTVQSSTDRGLGVRFTDVYKAWAEDTAQVFKLTGFTDKSSYKKFINVLVRNYAQKEIRNTKNLDELIYNLGGEIAIRNRKGDKQVITNSEDLASIQEDAGEQSTKEELQSKRKPEQVLKRFKWNEAILKNKIQDVVDMWGPKIQEYLFKLTPEDGKFMRETIVNDEKFPTIRKFTEKIKSGLDVKAGFRGLLNTKEVANKALGFIFSETVDVGEYAWKVLLTDYIKNKSLESVEFTAAVKLLLYKDLKVSEGLEGAALKNALSTATWNEISRKYSDEDVDSYLKKQSMSGSGIDNGIKDLNKNIKEIIKKNEGSSAFKNFFGRLRTWDTVVGKDLETKVERILAGDDPSPVKMDEATKAKMVSEYQEIDTRVKDKITKLEEDKKDLERDISNLDVEDPEMNLELEDINKELASLRARAVTKERLDVTSPEATKFLDKMIAKLIEERLQKAYTKKEASYSDFIKSTFYFLRNKGKYNGKTYL